MDGLYLVEPHAYWIWEGKKKLIIKSVNFTSHIGKLLYLCGEKVYGIIKLLPAEEIGLKGFNILKSYHLISDKERIKWWDDKQILYAYLFEWVEKFKEPKDYKYKQGVQNSITDVKLITSNEDHIYVKNLGYEAEVNKPPAKHPGFKPSCLVYSKDFSILIDVTKDIFEQLNIEEILNLDAIFITHCHSDSIDGFVKLNSFLKKYGETKTVYAYIDNVAIIKNKFKDLTQIDFKPYKSTKTIKIKRVAIKPIKLIHDILDKFPTYGYTLYIGDISICYASDFGFKKGYENVYDFDALSNNELAILDGAYWQGKTNFWNHVSVLDHFTIIAGLNNKWTYFTGYGNTYPANLDLAEKVLDFYLQTYKKEIDPDCKVEKVGLVKDKQIFDLNKIKEE